jgi:hypothetical protein
MRTKSEVSASRMSSAANTWSEVNTAGWANWLVPSGSAERIRHRGDLRGDGFHSYGVGMEGELVQ